MNLRWLPSFASSCMHAAQAVANDWPFVDARLQPLIDPARRLADAIDASKIPPDKFWRSLTSLAHHWENNRELATSAIRKSTAWHAQHESLAAHLGGLIGEVENAMRLAIPTIAEDLRHRERPIREQWEARGPGVLHAVGRLTDERLLVSEAEVVLVHPALGGGGAAHLLNNSVRLEAVLTNNVPHVPEVVRLGWLLAQLNSDLPMFSEKFSAERLPLIAQLAFISPVFLAAQEVELATFDTPTMTAALMAWRIPIADAAQTANTLEVWWQTYADSRPDWSVALTALDQMIAP